MTPESSKGNLPSTLPLPERSVDLRMVSTMRLVLSFSALLAISIDPPESADFLVEVYSCLILYTVYGLIIDFLSNRRSKLGHPSWQYWLDVAWYVALIALSGGSNSIFFFFFYFPILVASFGWGYTHGLRVTMVSTVLFVMVAFTTSPLGQPFALNRFLLRYVSLVVLGYLIAYWGGLQSKLKARLRLLKEVALVSNPRFGVERTIQSVLESLRSSYQADSCLLILHKQQAGRIRLYGSSSEGPYTLHRADRNGEDPRKSPAEISEEMAGRFLANPLQTFIYRRGKPGETILYDTRTGSLIKGEPESLPLLTAFEGKSCFSVPVYSRGQPAGRLCIVGSKHRFDFADVDFVLQVLDQVTRVLENIRLVDNLASDAAGHERRRIAQDIHDSIIQPYIGLQFGLAAMQRKVQRGENVLEDLDELLALTNGEIADLRSYVGGLRKGETPRNIFLPAVRRFAAKFSEATGLTVEIEGSDDLPIYDRLAAELFQMIEEGLSNVRRHSTSTYAKLDIAIKNGHLEMHLRNERLRRMGAASFVPRSIADRAFALGGQTTVYTDDNHDTVVCVQIPL